jgi:hypothetical protein
VPTSDDKREGGWGGALALRGGGPPISGRRRRGNQMTRQLQASSATHIMDAMRRSADKNNNSTNVVGVLIQVPWVIGYTG